MLVSEIIALVEAQCDESYSEAEWVALLNLCLDEVTPIAKSLGTVANQALNVASGVSSIAVPATAHEIKSVQYKPAGGAKVRLRRLSFQDMYSRGWKIDSDNIYLQGLGSEVAGTIDISNYEILPHIVYDAVLKTFTPASPPIPAQYHGMFVSYLCGKSQQREEEADDEKGFMAEYASTKQTFTLDRLKIMEPSKYKALSAQVQSQAE